MAGLFKKAPASAGAKKVSNSPIVVAADLVDPTTGQVRFPKEAIAEAITGYAEGKTLEKQGEALMESHKGILGEFARSAFARLWVQGGTRPKSPKITTNSKGTGTHITMSFIDKPSMMNDEQYAELVNLLGADAAEQCVERFTHYSIDAQIAARQVNIKGKNATFQEHIEEALLGYFPEDLHETIGAMLKPKEVFQTKKGLLERGLDLVGRGTANAERRLAEFLVKARIITSYKPGAVGDDE